METTRNAAMLWTGGKDSAMALHEAVEDGYRIRCLVTFAPSKPDFLAHPLDLIKMQASALAIPHHVLPINAPYERSYEAAMYRLRDELDIDCVVTGDIAEVDGNPNWIRERCLPVGLNVHTPLWGRDRNTLLQQLLDRGFKIHFSCVDTRWLDASWVGRELDASAIADLRTVREQNGLDLCGENGEYHTMVIDGPQFTRSIAIHAYSRHVHQSLTHIKVHALQLD